MENSTRAPCWQQQQIARQNSYLASLAAGRPVAYKAPCDVDEQPPAPAPTQRKPSAHVAGG